MVLACWYWLFWASDTRDTPIRDYLPSLSFLPVPSDTTVPTSGKLVLILVLLGIGGIGIAVPLLTIQPCLVSVLAGIGKMLFKGKLKRVYPPSYTITKMGSPNTLIYQVPEVEPERF